MDEQEQVVLQALLEEAKRLELSEQDAIAALVRVLVHNEQYRRRPSRRGKQTAYDHLLKETQPALALAWKLLCERQAGGSAGGGQP